MVDWTTYKDRGAWTFEKSPSKPRYNVGSSIATSEDPTWDTYDFTGEPVSDGHDPCGYWPDGTYVPPEPPEPPPEWVQYIPGGLITGQFVVWGPVNDTLSEGRFVKSHGNTISYSDDGGLTWTDSLTTNYTDIYFDTTRITYQNELFFAYWTDELHYSSDAINWTTINLSTYTGLGTYRVLGIVFHSYASKFVVFFKSTTSSSILRIAYVTTFPNIELKSFNAGGYYTYWNPRLYSFQNYVYSCTYRSDDLDSFSSDWAYFQFDSSVYDIDNKGESANNGTVLVCGTGYTTDIRHWTVNNPMTVVTHATSSVMYSYNTTNGFIGLWRGVATPSTNFDLYVFLSDNGIDWTAFYEEVDTQWSDVAMGSAGFVILKNPGAIIFKREAGQSIVESENRVTMDSIIQRWRSYQGQTPWTL